MSRLAPTGAGIGLRSQHYRAFLDGAPPVDWLEVHSENFFGDGGYDLHVLEHVRARYPLALHGVGLALGSVLETAQDEARFAAHLSRLAALVERVEPAVVSEHLSWGTFGARHFNDLLPLPYTSDALRWMCIQVTRVQERLRRPILVENVSSYVTFAADEMSELAFLDALARRTGCRVLLDINNLYVNAANHGFDAAAALGDIAPEHVGEIHLAGHVRVGDTLVDDHGSRVAPAVWKLYEHALEELGPIPTLVEWDMDVPALPVLIGEADAARRRLQLAHV
ncbi:MAG TPA: DUF692 domain-containing protein [Casimicrobiaceae bacterium]|nr:DUF692 domain-containing protein [Casimicrobiaceae bacterium]